MIIGYGLIALVVGFLWFWALIDALRYRSDVWERAQQNQIVWILVILFGNALGAIIYLSVARPQLRAAG